MNATISPKAPGHIQQALRAALTGPGRKDVQSDVGWDNSQVTRFLTGEQGITIDKMDALVNAVGFVLVTARYMSAVATLGEVGMNCECARQGRGECSPNRN